MYKVVRQVDGTTRKISDNKSALNLITKDILPDMSLALTEAVDCHEVYTTNYNCIYYVLTGSLGLDFKGEKHILNPGDSCMITKGTTYTMSGTFKTVVVNQPAFGT